MVCTILVNFWQTRNFLWARFSRVKCYIWEQAYSIQSFYFLYHSLFSANISTISSEPILEPPTVDQPTLERLTLERWEDTDVRLLITTYADNKHRFGGKATKKDVFEKIAEQFTKTSGRLVSGEQCMRKWGKITSKQKEIEDHNQKTGNSKKTWKFYDELQ